MKTATFDNKASVTAAANLTAKYLIGYDGNVCGANAAPFGASLADTGAGYECPLQTGGIAVLTAGGIFAAGDALVSTADGKVAKATTFAAAAPVADDTKLTVDAGSTPVTSSAANGAIISAAGGFLAAPALTGSVLPQVIVGYAVDASTGDGVIVRVKLL